MPCQRTTGRWRRGRWRGDRGGRACVVVAVIVVVVDEEEEVSIVISLAFSSDGSDAAGVDRSNRSSSSNALAASAEALAEGRRGRASGEGMVCSLRLVS